MFGVGFETQPENLKLIDKKIYLLILDFLLESQSQQKLATNITHFRIYTVLLKKHHSFLKRQLTQHFEKYTPRIQLKTLLTLYRFSNKPVSGW